MALATPTRQQVFELLTAYNHSEGLIKHALGSFSAHGIVSYTG